MSAMVLSIRKEPSTGGVTRLLVSIMKGLIPLYTTIFCLTILEIRGRLPPEIMRPSMIVKGIIIEPLSL